MCGSMINSKCDFKGRFRKYDFMYSSPDWLSL